MSIDINEIIACPYCKGKLDSAEDHYFCPSCQQVYPVEEEIPIFFVEDNYFKGIEAMVQSQIATEYTDMMQLNSLRNVFYHADFLREISQVTRDSVILEIGGGVGQDGIELLREGFYLIETDISKVSLLKAREEARCKGLQLNCSYMVVDGENLPFVSNRFDAVFAVAALHHMPNPETCIQEMARCAKTGGLVILGMEPNSWYYRIVRPLGKKVEAISNSLGCSRKRAGQLSSIAEATTSGFSRGRIIAMLENAGLTVTRVKPVWFLCGFLHYALELMFVMLHRRQRAVVNPWLEKAVISLDEILSKIPLINQFPWSWNVVAIKG